MHVAVNELEPTAVVVEPIAVRAETAAAMIGVSKGYLAVLRSKGGGPPFTYLTEALVVYPVEPLRAWIKSKPVHRSTSDPGRPYEEAVGA